jgi:polysaccharide export outer membrane protein
MSKYNRFKKRPTFAAGPILIGILLSIVGCSQPEYTDFSAFVTTPRPTVTSKAYTLAPPDTITIYSKRVTEISGHTETIRPDGRITLPLLGSYFVAGKTPEQVSSELQQLAAQYYEDADVSLRVVGFNSKRIFVFGEVGRPGAYSYNGANTVLQTLAMAQPSRLADPTHIHVLRPNAKGEMVKRMTIDLDKMVKQGDTALDAVLNEGDILYVPANGFAAVGLALQQVLLPIQPAAQTVAAPVNIGGNMTSYPYRGTPDNNNN